MNVLLNPIRNSIDGGIKHGKLAQRNRSITQGIL